MVNSGGRCVYLTMSQPNKDDIQKLHTTTVKLNETPWRLTHHKDIFAVVTDFELEEIKMNGEGDAKQHAKLPLSLKCKIFNFLFKTRKNIIPEMM